MFWKRRVSRGRITGNLIQDNSIKRAAHSAVEALETRRLFAMTSVPIDNAPPLYTMDSAGDYVLVGQPNFEVSGNQAVGQVSVVNAQTGQAEAPIANPDPDELDSFGSAVALLGNGRIAVASIEADGHGRVYIYDDLNDSSPLVIDGPGGGQLFGFHVAALGSDEVLISALTQSGVDQSGAVHVYNAATGAHVRTLTSGLAGPGVDGDNNGIDDGIANDQFGRALAVSGDNILVGAQDGAGNAYVALVDTNDGSIDQTFSEVGNFTFGQTVALTDSYAFITAGDGQRLLQYSTDGSFIDTYTVPDAVLFGLSFDVEGDKLIVGDEGANDGIARFHGAAYVFDLDDGPSTFQTLEAPDKTTGDAGNFGTLVGALPGERFAVLDVLSQGGVPISTSVHVFSPDVGDPNSAPVAIIGTYGAVDENNSITLDASGSSDADVDDVLTYAWDLDNDGEYDDATGLTVAFSRDLPGSYTVGLLVSDGTDESTDSTVLTFNNVAPTADAGADQSAIRGQAVNFSGSGASTSDSITSYEWDFDYDGSTFNADASGANASHTYDASGTFTVALRVTDDDGESTIDTATVTVTAAGIVGGDLVVGGTGGTDIIRIGSGAGGTTTVTVDGQTTSLSPTGRIIVNGGSSDDLIIIDSSVTRSTEVHGGGGNDIIQGGGGSDVIVGDTGIDVLAGGSGRDMLIGGSGSDLIAAGDGEDVLVAGTTSHDNDSTALQAIQAEWNSSRTYNQRVANLRDGSGSATRLNGSYFLSADATVFDDGSFDIVAGGSGRDLFFYNSDSGLRDLTDRANNETFSDVDVIPA